MIKNEVRKLNDFGRLFWRPGGFSATQRLEGEVYLTLKGGTPPGHRLAKVSGGRASSEPTFFDANFRIDF